MIIKSCPFCERPPKMMIREESEDRGYFCTLNCFCGGYTANTHIHFVNKNKAIATKNTIEKWNERHERDYQYEDIKVEDFTIK